MMSVLKGKKMDKKQVQETYRETTPEEEQEYFEEVENELQCDLQTTQESIDYRNQAIKAQKKYMRDSHGDMDDEEFLQNMNNVNNDTFFIEHAAKQVDVLAHQIESPYFGKIAFEYQEDGQVLPVYIGTNGYWSMDEQDQKVYDWRAPIASMYYDYEKGEASYQAPDKEYFGKIVEKKQFDISNGRLHNAVDTDEKINDMILLDALGKNSGTKMKSVVATIQKEQNALIRNKTAYNLIVDGRAGSGKTVVAMHRLAWLLFNNRKTMSADNVMILSPNGIFGDYIAGVLPEVGEDNVPEKEFDSLMEEILFVDCDYETKLEQADRITTHPDMESPEMKNIAWKSSIAFYQAFNKYLEEYTANIKFKDFHFEKTVFTKDQIEKMFYNRFARYPVYERFEKIAYFIADRVEDEQDQAFTDEKHQKMENQITKEMIYQYAERNLIELYQNFLNSQAEQHPGIEQYRNEYGKVCYEDILAVFYLQIYFYGCKSYDNIEHLVIDEMQDYNIFQYAVLDRIFKCKKTILGDSLQVLYYNPEETVLDVLQTVFVPHGGTGGCQIKTLDTAYRSTCEITEFCNRILEADRASDEVEAHPLNRHGMEPVTEQAESIEDAAGFIAEKLDYGELDDFDNVAILCDDEERAFAMYKELEEYEQVTYLTNQSTVYNGGVVVLPKFLAKGMEFDAVFVINEQDVMENRISRHAFYISCTRALHQLYVIDVTNQT